MYIPIAILHNERGFFTGMRFFQWAELEDTLVDIYNDTAVLNPDVVYNTSEIGCHRTVELSLYDVFKLRDKGSFIETCLSYGDYNLRGLMRLTHICTDGRIMYDTVLIFRVWRNESTEYCMICDHNGRVGSYIYSKLRFLCTLAKISIGNSFFDEQNRTNSRNSLIKSIGSGQDYMTESEVKRVEQFMSFAALSGHKVTMSRSGWIQEIVVNAGDVLVSDFVDDVYIDATCKADRVVCLSNSGVICKSSILRTLIAPVEARYFIVTADTGELSLTLPEVMRSPGGFGVTFELDLENISSDLRVIDQSKYELLENSIKIRGRNSVQRAVLTLAWSIRTVFHLGDARALRSVELISTLSTAAESVKLSFYLLPESLDIVYKTYVNMLFLHVSTKDSMRIVRIKHTDYNKNGRHQGLSVFVQEFSFESSVLVIVVSSEIASVEVKSGQNADKGFLVPESGTFTEPPPHWLMAFNVASLDEEGELISEISRTLRGVVLVCEKFNSNS